jgi:hypothetical protein
MSQIYLKDVCELKTGYFPFKCVKPPSPTQLSFLNFFKLLNVDPVCYNPTLTPKQRENIIKNAYIVRGSGIFKGSL